MNLSKIIISFILEKVMINVLEITNFEMYQSTIYE